jgi:hypothetical protein
MIRDNKAFIQRTKDGYFNATILLDDWNKKNGIQIKQMARYKKNASVKSFVEQLQREGIADPYVSSRGKHGGTWMHPKLMIDFAMWVSVEFKSIIIDYILDGLITSRHEAGDYYRQMSAAILKAHLNFFGTKPNPGLYISEAKRIKKLLGVEHKDRNLMTEKELNSVTQLQKLNSMLLMRGVGKDARIRQLTLQTELLKM